MGQVATSVVRQKGITTSQRDSLTALPGEFWKIYNLSTSQWEYWNGSAWVALDMSSGGTVDFVSNVATDRILGRTTAGSGDSEELTATQVRTLINVEDNADVTDETNVKSSLDGATILSATVATGDKVIIQDVDDSDNIKTVTAQSIADLAGGGGTPPLFGLRTTQASRTSTTTLVIDADLQVELEANSYYEISCFLVNFSAGVADIKYGFSVPTGATAWVANNANSSDMSVDSETTVFLAQSSKITHLKGSIKTIGTAGTFGITWAQQVSSASASTIEERSYIKLTKLD